VLAFAYKPLRFCTSRSQVGVVRRDVLLSRSKKKPLCDDSYLQGRSNLLIYIFPTSESLNLSQGVIIQPSPIYTIDIYVNKY